MGLGGVISNLFSLGAKLLPAVRASAGDQNLQIEAELEKLMKMLERIKDTLHDAEQREIRYLSVKRWLKELKEVAYDAEDVLDEYHYEVLRAQIEARDASPPDSHKRKLIEVPSGMLKQIQQIRSKFDEIANDRIALELSDRDGPERCNNKLQIASTSHFVVQSNIFGREREKEKLINLLSSKCDIVSVVAIVGMGGIGKTTLAQLAYNDQSIRQKFDKFGWICVSEDFNVEKLTKKSVESITGNECGLTNLSTLQEKILREVSGKRVLLVLDDVWNEKESLWDSFQAPFISAAFEKILVTTRNDHVAQIMQTQPTFNLGYLSDEQCWQLFEHYAFRGVKHNKGPKFVEIGKQIMKKCGMLPLAVKSIASLLRHETEEKGWREILENELWDSHVSNEIFPPLQISYAHLPTYLKPCFLYCSMFPKNYCCSVKYMVKLWVYQGFIESKRNKTAEKIGFEYAQQLCQRSFFESADIYEGNEFVWSEFKLHDIVHDLARLNSENSCYSIEVGKLPKFPDGLFHLYIAHSVNLIDHIPSDKFIALRTLIISSFVKGFFSTFDLSMAPKLRALDISGLRFDEIESLSSVVSLEKLRTKYCSSLQVLPDSLCQLKALRKLCVLECYRFKELPSDIGNLKKLQTLEVSNTGLCYLPPSLSKLVGIQALKVEVKCETIRWLKDFHNLGGTLSLCGLRNISNLTDVQCANIVCIRNLEHLILSWNEGYYQDIDGSVLQLNIESGQTIFLEDHCFLVIVSLQPHPNLSKLHIEGYSGITFPEWIGSLCKLKYFNINLCNSFQFLKAETLPLELHELEIAGCHQLVSMPGIQKLKSLVKLSISNCQNLCSFMEPSLELTMGAQEGSFLGLRNLVSLRSLKISSCFKLQVLADESLPLEFCKVKISNCPGLKQWCLQNGINYKDKYVTWGAKLIHNLSNVESLRLEFYCVKGKVCTTEFLDEETTQEGLRDAFVQREFLKTIRIVGFENDNGYVDQLINKLLAHVNIIGEIIV
ncbi:putative disease resistance protein RGA3 [Carex rostrata]